jgi:hypothetical protein
MARVGAGVIQGGTILGGVMDELLSASAIPVGRAGVVIIKHSDAFSIILSHIGCLQTWLVADMATNVRFLVVSFLRRLGELSPRGGLVVASVPDDAKSVISSLIRIIFSGSGADKAGSREVQAAACELLPLLLPGYSASARVPMSPSLKDSPVSKVALDAVQAVTARFPLHSTDIPADSGEFHEFSCLLRPLLAAVAGWCCTHTVVFGAAVSSHACRCSIGVTGTYNGA